MASHLKKQLRCSATPKVWIGKTLTILCPSVAKRLGISAAGRVLLVVYTLRRLKHGQESVRIISARQASRKERKAYAGWPDRFLRYSGIDGRTTQACAARWPAEKRPRQAAHCHSHRPAASRATAATCGEAVQTLSNVHPRTA